MSIRVRLEHGQGAGTTWRLTAPGVYLLGRVPQSSIQVLDMRVSKEHAEIHLAEDGRSAALRDLGSTHGCQVNGQPVKGQRTIKAGDEVRMGLSILRVLSDGEADQDLKPVAGRKGLQTQGGTPIKESTHRTLPADALVGKELGGYRLEKKIGAGGMGGVYLAEQLSLHRKVALKVLNERFAADRDFVDQFVNEARAAGALNHPNVVQVYDVGSAEGHHYFSMEVMPGGSIEDKIAAGGAPWATALNWFLDAANALIFARKKEILHRDVKPDNLMLAEDGSAKLCDLGLAKKSEHGDLMDQGIIGTPHFISPEAIRRKPNIDHRTDLYSLGCTFYRILTGKNPYPGKSVKEILLGHLNKPVPRVRDRNEEIPRDLDEIVAKLMQKAPDDRYDSPTELLAALDKVRLRHGLEAHGIKPGSKKPLIIAGVLLLAALGAVAWLVMKPKEVVVKPLTPQQKAQKRRDEINRIEVSVTGTVQEAQSAHIEREGRFNREQLFKGQNWQKPVWPDLATAYSDAGNVWRKQAEDWIAAAGKLKDDDMAAPYRTGASELESLAGKSEKRGGEITTYVKRRKETQVRFEEDRETALAELKEAITGHAGKIEAAQRDRAWLLIPDLLHHTSIDELVAPFAERKLGEDPLLDANDDIAAAVKEQFGERAEGFAYFGKDVLTSAEAAVKEDIKAFDAAVTQLVGDSPTPASYLKAVERIDEEVLRLPATVDPKSGSIGALLIAQREAAAATRKTYLERAEQLKLQHYAEDRVNYGEFLRSLFRPAAARGWLNTLDLASAQTRAKAVHDDARTKPYRELCAHWVRALASADKALAQMVATFPDGWSSDKTSYADDRGRDKTGRFKAVTRKSITRDKTELLFNQQGLRWVLENVFLDGDEARFELGDELQLGLATLAEAAGRYDIAAKAYAQFARTVDTSDVRAGIDRRMGSLELERQVAEQWRTARDEVERIVASIQAKNPRVIGMDAFTEDMRAEISAAKIEYARALQRAEKIVAALREDKRFRTTAWLAAISKDLPADAAYTGERLP